MKKKLKTKKKTAGEEKTKLGRPKQLDPELNVRKQIRCSEADLEAWNATARSAGFPNTSSWLRKVANDAIQQHGR